jgi:hypothetical protein
MLSMKICRTLKMFSRSFLLLLIFGHIVFATEEKQPSSKQLKIFAMQNGKIVAMQNEYGFDRLETMREIAGMTSSSVVASSATTVHTLRLSGERAKLRFAQGTGFNFLAEFPSGADARYLQLLRFATVGKQRMTYTHPYNSRARGSIWNTVPFKAGMRKDLKWVLIPPDSLPVGEYCFSLIDTDSIFCFGVDP